MAKNTLSFLGPQSELAGNQPEMSALVQMLMQANGMMPQMSQFSRPMKNQPMGGQMPGGQIPMGRPPVNKPPGSTLPPQVPPTTPPVTPPTTPPGTPPGGGGAAPSSFSWEAWNKLPGVQDQNLSSVMQYLTSQYGGPQANPYANLDWKKML